MVRADSLSDAKREAFLHSLGKLKQRVLWKWENDTIPNQPPNVFIRKWMPQRDILCEIIRFFFVCALHDIHVTLFFSSCLGHPNVRVFMTHGGLLGSSEAGEYFCF